MGWIVRIETRSEDETEILMSDLWDLGTLGVSEVNGQLLAGFDAQHQAAAAMETVTASGHRASIEQTSTDWSSDATTTVTVEGVDGPIEIQIVAGESFGHGHHATTRLALNLLVDELTSKSIEAPERPEPGSVLDLGTGSGILAIAACLLGAEQVIAVDIDPAARAAARANVSANSRRLGVDLNVEVIEDDVNALAARGNRFDLVVANVLLSVHKELAATIVNLLTPGGRVITAGTLKSQAEELQENYGEKIEVVTTKFDGDWLGTVNMLRR